MLGLELVADRKKKTPAGNSYMAAIAAGAHQAGAMIRTSGNIVILSPPMNIVQLRGNADQRFIGVAFENAGLSPAK
jgi:adenosylmethionine-8-amino-7-oxononanoate aminotransferase